MKLKTKRTKKATLSDLVKAAHEAGVKVTTSLEPREMPARFSNDPEPVKLLIAESERMSALGNKWLSADIPNQVAAKRAKNERLRLWRAFNPDKVRAQRKRYAKRHPDKVAERHARYFEKHKPRLLAEGRLRHFINRDRLNSRSRAYHHENRTRLNSAAQKRYHKNKPAYITRTKRWIAFNRDLHNAYTRKTTRAAVQELKLWYVAHKAKRVGANPKHHKQTIQLWRTKPLFKAMATASLLSSK